MEKKELDLAKFNKDFEDNDANNNHFIDNSYDILDEVKPTPEINIIDENLLKMRLAFDFIIKEILDFNNPINDILDKKDLAHGTILLLFFIGGLTLILAGLMKK